MKNFIVKNFKYFKNNANAITKSTTFGTITYPHDEL